MMKSEAIAIANNTAVILKAIEGEPQRAVSLIRGLLLNDPISTMKLWLKEGNYLPFSEVNQQDDLVVHLTLSELKRDEVKMGVIKRLWSVQGKKVDAIKQVRVWTGAGLKESKDFVEEL